jgi:mannose-6-phosphate isomerase
VRPEPTRIDPVFKERIWGARSLAPIYPQKTNLTEPIGEAWLTGPDSLISSGAFRGPLKDAWQKMPADWRGAELVSPIDYYDFPLLVKFLFPTDQLSIQVHPDDRYAARNESPKARGKTEMWHALSADPGATLLLGLVPDVDRGKFQSAITTGGLETFFKRWPVSAGDTFFVPPGMPHTIGAGMVLCEVQQNSDFTYRLYDFHRLDSHGNPRELHIDKAMAVINFSGGSGGKVSAVEFSSSQEIKKSLLAACPYFATERWDVSAAHHTKSDAARFELLIILGGTGAIQWRDGSQPYKQGECWLIPASLGQFSLIPKENTSLLCAYVPNIGQLRGRLTRSGASKDAVENVLFA